MLNPSAYRELKTDNETFPVSPGTDEREILKCFLIIIDRVGDTYIRERSLLIDHLAAVGGLVDIARLVMWFVIIIFLKPFNMIQVAKNYSRMRMTDGLAGKQE